MPPPDCGFQIAPPPQPHAPPAPCSCGDPILYLHGANKLPRHQGFGPRGGAETLGTRHPARNQKQPPSVCTMQKPPDTAQPPGHPNVTGGPLSRKASRLCGNPLFFICTGQINCPGIKVSARVGGPKRLARATRRGIRSSPHRSVQCKSLQIQHNPPVIRT